jgi:acetolactate synthase-1/2/3 large subunit
VHGAQAHAEYLANLEATPVEPMDLAAVVKTIEAMAPAGTVYTNGAGNYAGWLHRFHRYTSLQREGRTQLAPTAGAMGYGVPAAIAANLLFPDRTAVAIAGDGDFLMTGQELATATAHAAGRGTGRLVVVVVDNGSYGTIRMHQEREFPARVSGTALTNPDFVQLARAYGWHAERVETTAAFEPAFGRAMQADGPTLLHLPLPEDVSTSRTTLSALRAAALKKQGD